MPDILIKDKQGMSHVFKHALYMSVYDPNDLCIISNAITNKYFGTVNGDDILNLLWEIDAWGILH